MHTLLTIAIPTYNRADLLDQQLAWLAQAIKGFESEWDNTFAIPALSSHLSPSSNTYTTN